MAHGRPECGLLAFGEEASEADIGVELPRRMIAHQMFYILQHEKPHY